MFVWAGANRTTCTLRLSYYRLSSRSTGFTPNMLRFGREVHMPSDIIYGLPAVNTQNQTPPEFVTDLIDRLHRVHSATRENLKSAQITQKKDYDTRAPIKERHFDTGDLVYLVKTPIVQLQTPTLEHLVQTQQNTHSSQQYHINQTENTTAEQTPQNTQSDSNTRMTRHG